MDVDEPVTIFDRITPQRQRDDEAIAGLIDRTRQEIAVLKLAYHMAKAGIPNTGGHLNQHREALEELERKALALEALAETGLPDPTPLEVVAPPTLIRS